MPPLRDSTSRTRPPQPHSGLFAAMRSPGGTFAWLVILALSWGSQWPAMKAVLGAMSVLDFRATTITTAGILLLVICRLSGHSLRVPREHWKLLLLGAFFNITLWNVLLGTGLSRLSAGRSTIIAYLMPVFSAGLGTVFLKEPLTRRVGAALVLGLAALAVLIGDDIARIGAAPVGALLMLGAAIAWALGNIPTKLLSVHLSPLTQAAWQMALGSIPLAIPLFLFGGDTMAGASPMIWALVASNVVFGLVVPYVIWFALLGNLPASTASVSVLMSPCVGVVTSALALGEPIGPAEVTALGLVLAAIATVLLGPALKLPGRH
ncbi:MAG: DMT family transporter [Alphaproteobacteria bacterium]|nr:DMT family transporter [Alphaproteobacteria bacterium]